MSEDYLLRKKGGEQYIWDLGSKPELRLVQILEPEYGKTSCLFINYQK